MNRKLVINICRSFMNNDNSITMCTCKKKKKKKKFLVYRRAVYTKRFKLKPNANELTTLQT
jgi:hypothetical protein